MKIHLVSDIHLEGHLYANTPSFKTGADIIVLAGDIAPIASHKDQLGEFLSKAKDAANHVIYVLGNHEFYRGEWTKTISDAYDLSTKLGVHLLDIETNPTVTINNRVIWGSTLWTDMARLDERVTNSVSHLLADYRYIANNDRRLTPQDTFNQHRKTFESINWDADVIITHHCPIALQHSRYPYSEISHGFYCYDTEIENNILSSKNLKLWLYGHTHDSRTDQLGNTQLVANCYGYLTEYTTGFNPDLIIEI